MDTGSARRKTIVSTCCAVAGGIGAVACSLSMTLAAVGIIGTAAAASGSMAGMEGSRGQTASSGRFGSLIRFLVQVGPPLLIISVVAITVSLGLRRRPAVIPAVLAGAVMYSGMYLQSGVPFMYASIALALIVWTSLYAWTQRGQPRLRPDGTEGQAA
jgi:hypothetical protein